jgi:alanine dehydrogenase
MDGASPLTVGFPRMHKEAGERRDFLPDLVRGVAGFVRGVVVESGIGSGMGIEEEDYTADHPNVRVGTNAEAFAQDVVVTLRSPETEEFTKLRRGATLMAMLHFSTRPARMAALQDLGLDAVALDRIVDDSGRRLVVNGKAVAWNGLEAAFDVLEESWPALADSGRPPMHVTVMGVGTVGRHAVEAATKYGSDERRDALMREGVAGVVVRAVGRNVTSDEATMRSMFGTTDVLVDASQRDDPTRPLVPNAWLAELPPHAVVCDLVVDPYLLDMDPPTVRSIEGIPRGDLDQYVFAPQDPSWSRTIPEGIPTDHRRHAVSCYSWPGVHPRSCMELYGMQLAPLLEVLIERGGAARLRSDGSYLERALWRGSLRTWLQADGSPVEEGRGGLGAREAS